MKSNNLLTDSKLTEAIAKDKKIRTTISQQSHFWFFNIYFPHYLTFPTALFQLEMFELSQQDNLHLFAIMAFRGSGKSTIMNLSYTLWSILGKFQKKFIIIISQTHSQAEGHFSNILYELKNNKQLSSDLGPFEVNQDFRSIIIKNLNAKIMFTYRGQSIRGMRHGSYRPDLIILDDIEDSKSVQLELTRNITYDWFETEIIPTGDFGTTIIILGNLLHEHSFMMRVKENINTGKTPGIFRAYPLLDDLNQILWPEKFTIESIQQLKEKTNDELVWRKEYLLMIDKAKFMINDLLNTLEQDPLDEKNSQEKKTVRLGKYLISAPIIDDYTLKEILNRLDAR